nr:sigma 54-interacting transcriptional regulator [Kofleriaceae bacterium]
MIGQTISTVSVSDHDDAKSRHVVPQLIVALECDRPLAASTRHLLADLAEVRIGRGDRVARRVAEAGVKRLELGVPDRAMSTGHARVLAVRGRWVFEDAGSKNGSAINGKPVARAVLLDGDVLELGHTLLLYRDAVPVTAPEVADLDGSAAHTFVAGLAEALDAMAKIARTSVSVTVLGDTGTGKEVVARALHARSGRTGAFIPVNCGALPSNLVESMLFGHRKGAFSGATEDRLGLVRSADKGTLFLDEIGDLPLLSQTAFLRVLQEQEVTPVGDSRPIKVDFRLVAATHRTLTELVEHGDFRDDLYARMSGLTMRLPRLEERREDLGLLIGALLRRHGEATGLAAAPALQIRAARALYRYPWPLNVRELERALATALAIAGGGAIRLEHLPEALRDDAPAGPVATAATAGPPTESERLRAELVALLRQHDGNVAAVAKTMGKGRMQIHRWLKRFELELSQFRK